jgi:hypothetical protein
VLASPPTRNAGPNRPVPSSSILFLALQPQTAGSGNVVQEVGSETGATSSNCTVARSRALALSSRSARAFRRRVENSYMIAPSNAGRLLVNAQHGDAMSSRRRCRVDVAHPKARQYLISSSDFAGCRS